MSEPSAPTPGSKSHNGWRTFGIVVAVIVALLGVAALAVVVLFVIAINSWGSNK